MNLKSLQRELFQGKKSSLQLQQDALVTHKKTILKNPIAILSPLALQQAKAADDQRKKVNQKDCFMASLS